MSSIPRMIACVPAEAEPEHELERAPESDIRALLDAPVADSPSNDELEERAADALVAALVASGVTTFFGIPGGPVSPIFDAVLQNAGARLIESRHETNAAFAAVAYHRASGKVPCVVVTAGPGATNVVTGVVSAHLEGVPMVVIAGDVAWAAGGGRLLQDSGPEGIAVEQMLEKVVRRTIRVAQAKAAPSQALAALAAAENPARPGPALLVVPIHEGAAKGRTCPVAMARFDVRTPVPGEAVAQAAAWLTNAERPLLVLGAGCRRHAAAVRALVDACDVPFVTTPKAKGLVSERHPRSLRHGGLAASQWARSYTAEGVDAAVALGTDLDDCSVGPTPYIMPGGKLVHVDLDATVFNRNLPTALGVVADVGEFARALNQQLAINGRPRAALNRAVRQIKRSSAFATPDFREDESTIITPHRAIADLERAAGPDALFASDIGEHMLFAMHYLTADGPDRFHIQLGLGSMGSGISGAIGLAIGAPGRRVVCICGDGGMQMAGAEALVALRENLPVVFAVFNDARYNMVFHGYKQVFNREAAWDTPWVDFAGWARSMGLTGIRINHPGEITPRLFEALDMKGGPAVLDIRIDREVRLAGSGRNEALQHMSMQKDHGGVS